MKRKEELFSSRKIKNKESVSNTPVKLLPQERDWTCAIGCIRTILSALDDKVLEEDEFIERYSMKPGPHYSKDIKEKKILQGYDVRYGCDTSNICIDDVIALMKEGYYVMLESMVNYAHWMVLLGYYTCYDFQDVEKHKMLFYDPYYNEIKLMNADEFLSMWIDGNYAETKVEKDFIAIRNKTEG